MEAEFIESFVAKHGNKKAAKMLGVSPSYLSLTITRKRSVIVAYDEAKGKFRGYLVSVYGGVKNPTPQKRNLARRFFGKALGISA